MKKIKLLLVDDEEEFVKTLAERLRMRDLKPDTVHDGKQALDYVEETEPWKLAKGDDSDRLDTVLYNLCECCRLISIVLEPFLPDATSRMREQLGVGEHNMTFKEGTKWGLLAPDTTTSPGEPLFPRMDD